MISSKKDVLAVADLHRVGTTQARTVQALLAHLAPLALQVEIGPGGTGCDGVVSTGRHDPHTTGCDRERLAALAVELCPPACGVTTVRWDSDRPLQSARLSAALTGIDLDGDALRARLDACLCDDAELAAGVNWDDPFAATLGPAEGLADP